MARLGETISQWLELYCHFIFDENLIRIKGSHLHVTCKIISGQDQHGIKQSMYLLTSDQRMISDTKATELGQQI